MFRTILTPLAPLGRILLCAIFLLSAVMEKIPKYGEVVGRMREQGVPLPGIALIGAIVFLILGSVLVILGLKARIGALLLLVFLVLATYYFHDFWTIEDKDEAMNQMAHFMKNVALAGAMLFIMGAGAGPWSVDAYLEKRLKKAGK